MLVFKQDYVAREVIWKKNHGSFVNDKFIEFKIQGFFTNLKFLLLKIPILITIMEYF